MVEKPWEGWQLQFSVASAPRSGALVAVMDQLVLHRGDFVLGPIDEEIHWGERVHLAGANGSGKSTLVAGLLGRLEPASGRARLGTSVVVGVLGQERDEFSEDDRPLLCLEIQNANGRGLRPEIERVLADVPRGRSAHGRDGRHRATSHVAGSPGG